MSATSMRGDGFIEFMDDEFGRGLSISFMANQVPQFDNRIELHPTVKDKWGRPVAYVIKDWHPHDIPDGHHGEAMRQRAALRRRSRHPELSHPGTRVDLHGGERSCPDGEPHPRRSALRQRSGRLRPRPDCRAWEFDNLYVTDGAFMPTSGGANPTLTIEANSFRVADHLLTRI